MSLLANGPHTVLLFPAVRQVGSRGNVEVTPGPDPVKLERVWMFPATSVAVPGQRTLTRYELTCTEFPAGAWSRVSWDGWEFDVVGEPAFMPGSERARHWVIQLQARTPKAVPNG